MVVGDAYVVPGFLTPVLTQLVFPKPPTTFLTCFCRGERRKQARKKSRLNWGSNSQPPGHESDTLTTEPPRWGADNRIDLTSKQNFFLGWVGNIVGEGKTSVFTFLQYNSFENTEKASLSQL